MISGCLGNSFITTCASRTRPKVTPASVHGSVSFYGTSDFVSRLCQQRQPGILHHFLESMASKMVHLSSAVWLLPSPASVVCDWGRKSRLRAPAPAINVSPARNLRPCATKCRQRCRTEGVPLPTSPQCRLRCLQQCSRPLFPQKMPLFSVSLFHPWKLEHHEAKTTPGQATRKTTKQRAAGRTWFRLDLLANVGVHAPCWSL